MDKRIYFNPNSAEQANRAALFEAIMKRYEWMKWYQPHPDKAPWHWRGVVVGLNDPHEVWFNVYPHKGTVCIEGQITTTLDKLQDHISAAIDGFQLDDMVL